MPARPTRKHNRLQDHDYSQQGAYFITACAQNRAELFGHIAVGATGGRPFTELSATGRVVLQEIERLKTIHPEVAISDFVIMPNHVHLIVVIHSDGRPQVAPTVSRIIQQWKGSITKQLGFSPWQKSFHDHVIRGQEDYAHIAQYIENNPAQWQMDCLHPSHNRTCTP